MLWGWQTTAVGKISHPQGLTIDRIQIYAFRASIRVGKTSGKTEIRNLTKRILNALGILNAQNPTCLLVI